MKANHPSKEHRRKVAKRMHIDKNLIRFLIAQKVAEKNSKSVV